MAAKKKSKTKKKTSGLNKNLLLYIIVAVLVVFGFKYLSGPGTNAPETAVTEPNPTIEILDSETNPQTLEVEPGELVLVINKGTASHSVTSDDDLFDTGLLDISELGMFTAPLEPGEYTYYCTDHPDLTGTLVVVAN